MLPRTILPRKIVYLGGGAEEEEEEEGRQSLPENKCKAHTYILPGM